MDITYPILIGKLILANKNKVKRIRVIDKIP
jgi:hypothetical protein